jgi:hypothetical protein
MSGKFPYAPVKTNVIIYTSMNAGETSSFFDGLKKDLDDFRLVVRMLVEDHIDDHRHLSIDLIFFS